MKKIESRLNSRGQAILIVLLASAVVMTLGLSASKRTVIDTKIDTDEELLKQAFNTAESGVDYYLSTGTTNYSSPDGSSAQISVSSVGLGSSLVSDGVVLSNNPALFWMVSHREDGSIDTTGGYFNGSSVDICVDDSFNKSLKIDYFYMTGSAYKVARRGINFNNNSPPEFNFERKGSVGGCATLNTKPSGGTDIPLLLAITPINGSTKITVNDSAGNIFPVQGQEIVSVGRAGEVSSSSVGVNTQVKVVNRYLVPPFMLDAITAANNVLSK